MASILQPSLKIDHLSILSRSRDEAARFYGVLLPVLGFTQVNANIWRNENGLHLQFNQADDATRDYERYGPGVNHIGFTAPTVAFVERLAADMAAAGYEARLQRFAGGIVALFLPDPDGLRVEVSWYPPDTAPVS